MPLDHSKIDAIAARVDACSARFDRFIKRSDADPVSARELALYAMNTGQFYQQHLELARKGADVRAWARHVSANVVPEYKHEVHGKWLMHSDVIDQTARELKRYYDRHIKEF
jgi:hypothetical protein